MKAPRKRPTRPGPAEPTTGKSPFDIHLVMQRISDHVQALPKAAMFELADQGYRSLFEQLIACIISVRTREEVTIPTARALFATARTPAQVERLGPAGIDKLIRACTFHEPKSRDIHQIARRVVDEFGGTLPCDFDTLTSFRGVGSKCANLALGVACDLPHGVAVDIHVHRVTNRWGYVAASTPEKTMLQLQHALPREYSGVVNVPAGRRRRSSLNGSSDSCASLREMSAFFTQLQRSLRAMLAQSP